MNLLANNSVPQHRIKSNFSCSDSVSYYYILRFLSFQSSCYYHAFSPLRIFSYISSKNDHRKLRTYFRLLPCSYFVKIIFSITILRNTSRFVVIAISDIHQSTSRRLSDVYFVRCIIPVPSALIYFFLCKRLFYL